MDIQEYLNKRVEDQEKYFNRKAINNKKAYYLFSILKIVSSLTVTAISSFSKNTPVMIPIISSLVMLFESILLLSKAKENWIEYRITSENLKSEEMLFLTGASGYHGLNQDESVGLFVENIETIINRTNDKWRDRNKTKEEKQNA